MKLAMARTRVVQIQYIDRLCAEISPEIIQVFTLSSYTSSHFSRLDARKEYSACIGHTQLALWPLTHTQIPVLSQLALWCGGKTPG